MTDLTRYSKRSTVKLTTRGRKSGQARTVTIWFVVSGPRSIEVQHVSEPIAQWYRNLVADPAVSLDFGEGPIEGRATAIADPREIADVLNRIRRKHWLLGPLIQLRSGKATPVAARIEVA